MLYNFRIFEKRYRNKSISQIIEIVERNAVEVNKHCHSGVESVKRDLCRVSRDPNITRLQWFNFGGYVYMSISKVKEK